MREPSAQPWLKAYRLRFPVFVSSLTILERLVGYGVAIQTAAPERVPVLVAARRAYDQDPDRVLAMSLAVASVAAEILALIPVPPTPPRRAHRLAESRGDRLARWRFDALIAATALVHDLSLIHNNTQDFEAIRTAVELHPERFPGLSPLALLRCTRL